MLHLCRRHLKSCPHRSWKIHGFRAVRTSLAAMAQFHDENRFSRILTKAFMRAVDRVPPLKAAMSADR